MPSNEIMSMEGQLVGMPLAGPETFSPQQLDYLKRALGVEWQDITSDAITSPNTGIKLLYCPALKQCMLTYIGTKTLAVGTTTIGTVASGYRPSSGPLPATIMVNNSKYVRGWITNTGLFEIAVNEAMTSVGIRYMATWVVGE